MKTSIVQGGQLAIRMTDTADDRQRTLGNDRVILSHDFFESLRKSAVPLLEQAIKAIGASSLALDLYVWLSYRLRRLERPTAVTWAALHTQFGAEYARVRDFKRFVQQGPVTAKLCGLAISRGVRVTTQRALPAGERWRSS